MEKDQRAGKKAGHGKEGAPQWETSRCIVAYNIVLLIMLRLGSVVIKYLFSDEEYAQCVSFSRRQEHNG